MEMIFVSEILRVSRSKDTNHDMIMHFNKIQLNHSGHRFQILWCGKNKRTEACHRLHYYIKGNFKFNKLRMTGY